MRNANIILIQLENSRLSDLMLAFCIAEQARCICPNEGASSEAWTFRNFEHYNFPFRSPPWCVYSHKFGKSKANWVLDSHQEILRLNLQVLKELGSTAGWIMLPWGRELGAELMAFISAEDKTSEEFLERIDGKLLSAVSMELRGVMDKINLENNLVYSINPGGNPHCKCNGFLFNFEKPAMLVQALGEQDGKGCVFAVSRQLSQGIESDANASRDFMVLNRKLVNSYLETKFISAIDGAQIESVFYDWGHCFTFSGLSDQNSLFELFSSPDFRNENVFSYRNYLGDKAPWAIIEGMGHELAGLYRAFIAHDKDLLKKAGQIISESGGSVICYF